MNLIVNDQIVTVDQASSIEQLLEHLNKPFAGCALAVNQTIISRTKWAEHIRCEGDKISLFQAIAGG